MKKMFKIQYGILAFILLLIACKKDTLNIPKDDDRDIRILKVQYMGHDYDVNYAFGVSLPLMYKKKCTYHYDTDGRLTRIGNDRVRSATVEYNPEQAKATNDAEQDQLFTFYWNNSVIHFQGKRIDNIVATTRHLNIDSSDFTTWDRIDINRMPNGKLKSVMPIVEPDDVPVPSSPYSGIATEILSYNK